LNGKIGLHGRQGNSALECCHWQHNVAFRGSIPLQPAQSLRKLLAVISQNGVVRREKALVNSGCKSRPGTGSLHPVAIEAAVEVTKPLEPSM
jgi:hypothetical protein